MTKEFKLDCKVAIFNKKEKASQVNDAKLLLLGR